ncbi:MAG TPA: helix-turn-helix domain-containing protein [Candidatus Limnocylindrales bacterium]|nr:helix-turn-helix domain-containing protein [Candidatus Limnocylindrales bacterium]
MTSASEPKPPRPYRLRKRAAAQAETHRRIVEAASELHRTIGPAATTISEVARRAGVQRVTVYDHFPDDGALFGACSAHWRELHPAPDLAAWHAIGDPGHRLRRGLRELYAWYRETEPMTANILRDAEVLPALQEILDHGLGAWLEAAVTTLAEPFADGTQVSVHGSQPSAASVQASARGSQPSGGHADRLPRRLAAALRLATAFGTWRTLSALGDDEAAELMATFVELAAPATSTPPSRRQEVHHHPVR